MTEKLENLVIPDEAMDKYELWLEEFRKSKEKGTMSDEQVKSLFLMTICRLFAQNACVNKVDCARCPAAKETLIWARRKIGEDGILNSGTSGPAYSENTGLGSVGMSEVINTPFSGRLHTININVEERGLLGRVIIHTT